MIKKVIATAIIGLVALNGIQAQNKFKRELSLGASFCTTFSKVSFAQTKVQQKMKLGYTGGLTPVSYTHLPDRSGRFVRLR